MATFADILSTAASLLSGEPEPEDPSRGSWNSQASSQRSATELDYLDAHGNVISLPNSATSSPVIRSAARRAGERRQRRSGRKSQQQRTSSNFDSDVSDRDSYYMEDDDEPPLLDLTACIAPPSSSSNATRHRKKKTTTRLSSGRQQTTESTTTSTSRVVCTHSDTSKFLCLGRVGTSNRVSVVGRESWNPKERRETVQHLCLRTIGPLARNPKLALVLARGHDGSVRHLSIYRVLGRSVGVEWQDGVPTWSNRSKGTHVLQELDEAGNPLCPAVFDVWQWSSDPHRCMLSHQGYPLVADGNGRVALGERMTTDDLDGMETRTLFFNTPPIDLRRVTMMGGGVRGDVRERRPVRREEGEGEGEEKGEEEEAEEGEEEEEVEEVEEVVAVKEESHQNVLADGAVSWYLQGSVEYHFFHSALRAWMVRTATNTDETDPDRSWRWPVEYLADVVVDLFPTLSTSRGRECAVESSERVLLREFWSKLVHGVSPSSDMCVRLSRNLVWARRQKELAGESIVEENGSGTPRVNFVSAGHTLRRLRVSATPSWNVAILGEAFERLAATKERDEERSADFFLPAMVTAVALSSVPAETLLLQREILRSVYALGRQGYWSTTFYAAVEYILQLEPEFVVMGEDEIGYDSENNDEITDEI